MSVRLELQLSTELNGVLEQIASDTGTTKTDVIRQALALVRVANSAKREGRHIGLVRDSSKLDTEIVGQF